MESKCYNGPLTVNTKCIVISLMLAAGYWFLPQRNPIVLALILYLTYLAIAWYDYWYACQRNMGPTVLASFYDWAKPPESRQIKQYRNMCPDLKTYVQTVDALIAVTLIMVVYYYYKKGK